MSVENAQIDIDNRLEQELPIQDISSVRVFISAMVYDWLEDEVHQRLIRDYAIQITRDELIEVGEECLKACILEFDTDDEFIPWMRNLVRFAWTKYVVKYKLDKYSIKKEKSLLDSLTVYSRENHRLDKLISAVLDSKNYPHIIQLESMGHERYTPAPKEVDKIVLDSLEVPSEFAYEKRVFDEVIAELRSNKRITHPTKLEQVLNVFRANLGKPVTTDLLLPIFADTIDAERQVRVILAKLNQKLEPYNIRLEHVPGYHTTRTA